MNWDKEKLRYLVIKRVGDVCPIDHMSEEPIHILFKD